MLDFVAAFERGGAVLWMLQFTTLRHSPLDAINALIRGCLLEERLGENTFTYVPKSGAAQALKWTFHNGLGLVFVAVYQKTLSLLYVDELLTAVKDEFVGVYKPGQRDYKGFDDVFNRLLREAETRAEVSKRQPAMRTAAVVMAKQGKKESGGTKSGSKTGGDADADDDTAAKGNRRGNGAGGQSSEVSADGEDGDTSGAEDGVRAFDVSKLPKGIASRGRGVRGRPGAAATSSKAEASSKKKEDAAPKKKARNWNTLFPSGKGDNPDRIDYTEEGDGPPTASDRDLVSGTSASATEDEGAGAQRAGRGLLASFVSSLKMNVVGTSALSRADVEPALADMKRKLMERNVAEEIASQVCDSVGRRLEGQRLAGFTGVVTFVRSAFEEALSGILNKRAVDVLLDIKKSQARGKPYVIVFCGVNGVGKSTNLAKIAYWLGGHGIKVMIAACDTFRAGAVEQLKTHCARLRVPLYERGYEKDPAKVAYEAIRQAERDGQHVVLVDTAGRMQDNQPLMRALSNLIAVNNPNLVLFVGEALVGNDAVDQLTKFNKALSDLAPTAAAAAASGATGVSGRGNDDGSALTRRHGGVIDGIVLTKFDTIDDKVGAALSMVYTSGAPVMFVGCGQTYVDLKKLNVKSVVKSLLK
ncbi:hypothetical protein VOLCADRAFT_74239 [Volvox carteri f. nagariensis]|uniref:SRP54-type proteins GTP-binding domain-containing protein n=1 Tax=Volvox carteri f. nagariensis TaxID=3068 RepID=D8TSY9_VOLCA|nr:uncharacterized protein VOLCADRAFT_74239 [Volvox carteri f. nagariensis]EFJ49463.1 hypothetical protein VOLCADRAFT_74239 [Volvox carteri f. nagariensis]|eukprot:XP_002949444.1 hypothetical protein VOLCADRAFT_74239 [Volvox carteri f. nagariensis]